MKRQTYSDDYEIMHFSFMFSTEILRSFLMYIHDRAPSNSSMVLNLPYRNKTAESFLTCTPTPMLSPLTNRNGKFSFTVTRSLFGKSHRLPPTSILIYVQKGAFTPFLIYIYNIISHSRSCRAMSCSKIPMRRNLPPGSKTEKSTLTSNTEHMILPARNETSQTILQHPVKKFTKSPRNRGRRRV
jgi:hypothetical protein